MIDFGVADRLQSVRKLAEVGPSGDEDQQPAGADLTIGESRDDDSDRSVTSIRGDPVVVGPYQAVSIGGGQQADLYLLRYGADGGPLSPRTAQHLRESLEGTTDVFLFSHGWNNTFDGAAASYLAFIAGYVSQGAVRVGHRPVLVGVVWPSISFLMPWEDGPQIAGSARPDPARTEEMRAFVAESLDRDAEAQLSELVDGAGKLAQDQAQQAAEIVRAALAPGADPDDGSAAPSVGEILQAWALLDGGAAAKPSDPDEFGDPGTGAEPVAATVGGRAADPRLASGLGDLDPRNLLRMGTVWKMKDRAGRVGARGVAPLVRLVLDDTRARLHLIGHSFGARLVMSALAIAPPTRPARSMLLLQPAVNRWCFAPDVAGTGKAGGYRTVVGRVELPILATYSEHDFPLRQAFHLAVRGASLGEPNIAAIGDTYRFGALGGYGPGGLGAASARQPAVAAGGSYDLSGPARVIAVDGSGDIGGKPAIGGHSDISNPATWWALHCLTSAP